MPIWYARACREVTKNAQERCLPIAPRGGGSPGARGTCVSAPMKPFLLNSRSLGRKERGQQRLGLLDNVPGAWAVGSRLCKESDDGFALRCY